jgi:hypothetical protein
LEENLPWDLESDLTQERLCVLAKIFKTVREGVKEEAHFEKGDDTWGLGTKAYERYRFAIIETAKQYDWLHVIERSGQKFTFSVGRVPLRFYTGSSNNPPLRTLARRKPEMQLELALNRVRPRPNDEKEWFWRVAIELAGLDVADVVVFQANGKKRKTRNAWSIPLIAVASTLSNVVAATKEAVKLPKPPVTPKASRTKKKDDVGPA